MFTAENCREAYVDFLANRTACARADAIQYCEEKTQTIYNAARLGWESIDLRKPSGTQETVDIAKQILEENGFKVTPSHNLWFFHIEW